MPIIYKIINPKNKIYIGQTWDWNHRKTIYKGAFCKAQTHIYNSLIKYGFDNHILEVIEVLDENIPQELLDEREVYWWKYYKDLGYEMLNIKYPGRGGKHSAETICKIRQNSKGRIPWNKGIPWSQEVKDKISKNRKGAIKGFKMSEEAKRKISIANSGKKYPGRHLSDETKRKIGNFHKGHIKSQETRDKISKGNKGKVVSEEVRDKLRKFHYRPIIMLDLDGNFIKEFDYVREAKLFLRVSQNAYINRVLGKAGKYCGEYQFLLKKDYDPSKNYKINILQRKEVHQYDLDGNFIRAFKSTMDAEREFKIKNLNSKISKVCLGVCKQANGFIWKYPN